MTRRRKTRIEGNPDPKHVSTSFAERHNLNMRMQMRRFTRLTTGCKPIMAVGSNLLSTLTPHPLFDVILSSPPSFAGEPRDVADRAWHAGPSYRDIPMLFVQARERLASGGGARRRRS
jgi:hypothetical protein